MKCRTRASIFEKTGSLSNGVDDLENFTSEIEWSFFVPVGFSCVFSNWYSYISTPPAFPEVIKIPESKATAFQTLDSAVYSFNRTVGEIILDAVKNSCHVLLQGGDGCVHVLTRTTVVFQNINEPLPFFLQCIEYILIRIVDLFKLRVIFDNQVKGILLRHVFIDSP